MPPPGSLVLFLTINVGEDVPSVPPDVVSRRLRAALDICVQLLALVAPGRAIA